jgi:hypothetical protein
MVVFLRRKRRKRVKLQNGFDRVVGTTLFVFLSIFLPQTAGSAAERHKPAEASELKTPIRAPAVRFAGNFAQVEITLNDEVTLADISALPSAPESDLEVLDGGKRVRVQLPAASVETLADKGARITALRKFVLLEGSASQRTSVDNDVTPSATCSGSNYYDENPLNWPILLPWPNYYATGIDFSLVPDIYTVNCIDVYYEVRNFAWESVVDVELSDEDYFASNYTLVSGWWGLNGDIVQTRTGITAFNGESVSQAWYLWATDYNADGSGYIDRWWIKLYYDDEPPPPGYCAAEGDCSDSYISRVTVGAIDNSTACQAYSDYTSLSTTMLIGDDYPITVVNGYPFYEEDECTVWVDWNQDFDFDDPGENITMAGSPSVGPYTATITPPPAAALGDTRMRIRLWAFDFQSPCGMTIGEVEDYNVTVIAELPKYGGGSGTVGDPYLIYDANQMNEIGASPADWDSHFTLMRDIDLDDLGGTPFNLIGSADANSFTGVFDGNDNRIFNFTNTTAGTDFIGLFRYVNGASAEIKNLRLIAPNVDAGSGDYVGAVAGKVTDGSLTLCCVRDGTIAGDENVGGLVGHNSGGVISRCYVECRAEGTGDNVGGLVGLNNSQITNCYATGSVFGDYIIAGLVGKNDVGGSISKCYAANKVWATGLTGMRGGLVSTGSGSVSDSYWDYNVSLESWSAGGTSKTTEQMQTASTFSGWDFGTPVWTICEHADYPRLYYPNMKYRGGRGTVEDPYQLSTPCHLQELGGTSADWDKHFILTADVNLARYDMDLFNMIGNGADPFTGSFDGDGHIISNFTYLAANEFEVGLFGAVMEGQDRIANVTLVDPNVDIIGSAMYAGALVGRIVDDAGIEVTTISNCHVQGGTISAQWYVGGIVGLARGGIADSSSSADVYGDTYVGGLAGEFVDSTVENCSSSCTISGEQFVGGLSGTCHGQIRRCYSQAEVLGDNAVGGLVGFVAEQAYDSYAAGDVSGNENVGGFAGVCNGSMTNCYSVGAVTGSIDIGGLLGDGTGTITGCFWDVNTSGLETSAGGTGKTTGEMKTGATFASAGWNFVDVWKMCRNFTYPKLRWEKYAGGDGTPENPCLICRPEEMQAIGAHSDDWDKHFKLVADIDMGVYTGTQYNVIGRFYDRPVRLFDGSFNGNGHTISNFTYESPKKMTAGLFGAVGGAQGSNVVIKDLTLVDPNVDAGSGAQVGAIVGFWYRDGLLSNCRVIGGRVKGKGDIGGIMGFTMFCHISKCHSSADVIATEANGLAPAGGLVGVDDFGPISQCSSTGTVSAGLIAGGLVGWTGADANVTNCYSIATVDGNDFVGGLIGYVGGLVENCYSAGGVSGQGVYVGGLTGGVAGGSVIDSFWDVNTSGQPGPWAGTGLTTAEMQDPNTFISAGWDFFGEYQNGAENIWRLCEKGTDYPKLTWEFMPADFACPDGVGPEDLAILCDQWLESLLADFAPDGGDKFVNFVDWTVFANAWQATAEPLSPNWDPRCDIAPEGGDGIINGLDLFVVLGQWLRPGPRCADIAPIPFGDGLVSFPDFAVVALHWLEEVGP